jgi:protocatechuate 3,4-dioxygenase beta subunit
MNDLARALILVTLTLSVAGNARSQSPASQAKPPGGTIAGRVTIAGKPAANIPVLVTTDPINGPQKRLGISTTTDSDGHFQLTGVPTGRVYVAARAPACYSEGERGYAQGEAVTLAAGETIEDINISLRHGGVITGRITDAMGRPLIRHHVTLYVTEPDGKRHLYYSRNPRGLETDDRGIYRTYGLPPGRYSVSAGTPLQDNSASPGMVSGIYYPQVFYTEAGDTAKVGEIEITDGSEVTGIDIVLGRTERSYTVTMRTVAENGKPVAGLRCGCASMDPSGKQMQSNMIGPETNERGECRVDGILPGKYVALALAFGSSAPNYTYDPTPFEVTDADVANVEIKLRAGATISGMVVFEGVSAQEIAAYLRELYIGFSGPGIIGPSNRPIINPDGSFQLLSLPTGKVRLSVSNYPRRNVTLLRVDRDGVEQTSEFEIASGDNITGVRLVIGVGSGVIRGELKLADGALPDGFRPVMMSGWLMARRVGDTVSTYTRSALSDGRGRFVFEGLVPGEYEITINNSGVKDESSGSVITFKRAQQTVTVTNEHEAQVTITLEPQNPRNQ